MTSKFIVFCPDRTLGTKTALQLIQLGHQFIDLQAAFDQELLERYIQERCIVIVDLRADPSTAEKVLDYGLPSVLIVDDNTTTDIPSESNAILLTYPFSKQILAETVESITKIESPKEELTKANTSAQQPIDDRIFVRYKEKMVKIEISDIYYIEAESNYCRIFTEGKDYLLSSTLKKLEGALPPSNFFRIHRSYMVNLRRIDEVAESHLIINKKALPISKSIRPSLLQRLQTI